MREKLLESLWMFCLGTFGGVMIEVFVFHLTWTESLWARPFDQVIVALNAVFYPTYRQWVIGKMGGHPPNEIGWMKTEAAAFCTASILKNLLYAGNLVFIAHVAMPKAIVPPLTHFALSPLAGYPIGLSLRGIKLLDGLIAISRKA